jgi:outer membrane lipoprotein-sorting protein
MMKSKTGNITRKALLSFLALAAFMPLSQVRADEGQAPASLSATQIVDKTVAARGGLDKWRAVQTMSFSGKMDAGGKTKDPVQLPFELDMKRPLKLRVELEFANDKALQVYDGVNGWKLRPYLGRKTVEPYTKEEMTSAAMEPGMDGLLIDYAAKGNKVELEGVEKVDGQDAYKLKVTTKANQVRRVWVDSKTFLEVKMDGAPRRMDGKAHPVHIYMRDYRPVSGLMIPYTIETEVVGYKPSHKMVIEGVKVNPKLEDSMFAKPKV